MNSLLSKLQKSSSIVELRPLETLPINVPYAVIKMVWVQTKFGPAVQVHLQELTDGQRLKDEEGIFRAYLPKRISNVITQEDVDDYNDGRSLYTLVYRGKQDNAFIVDFY